MTAAVMTTIAPAGPRASTVLFALAKRFVGALVKSRMMSAELELRRHQDFLRDPAVRHGLGSAR